MPASGRKINLLPPSEFELSFWGKFLSWAVTTGRYIIILTELVVICAFLSRFKLDIDIDNLNSEIEGKKNVLEANATIEKEFRLTQDKVNSLAEIIAKRPSHFELIENVEKSIPEEIKLDSLTVTKEGIDLTAKTNSEIALGIMLSSLNQSQKWKEVILSQINSDNEKGIRFSVKMIKEDK